MVQAALRGLINCLMGAIGAAARCWRLLLSSQLKTCGSPSRSSSRPLPCCSMTCCKVPRLVVSCNSPSRFPRHRFQSPTGLAGVLQYQPSTKANFDCPRSVTVSYGGTCFPISLPLLLWPSPTDCYTCSIPFLHGVMYFPVGRWLVFQDAYVPVLAFRGECCGRLLVCNVASGSAAPASRGRLPAPRLLREDAAISPARCSAGGGERCWRSA